MVVIGLAVTIAPVVVFNPVEGDHAYVDAPLAVSAVLLPLQILGAEGVTVKLGRGFTVITTVFVFVHPAELVPVTV